MTKHMDLAQALTQAFGHLDQGRLPQARRLARDIEKARPDAPGLAYLQGLLALAEGLGGKAAQQLTKALAASPDAPPLLLALARAQAMQGRPEAEASYRRLLTIVPEAEEELAALLVRREQWAEAAPLLRAASLRLPGRAGILNNLGVTEKALGRIEAAALAFAQACDAAPAFAKAQANLAAVLRLLKQPEQALAAAHRATTLAPSDKGAWLELGQALRDSGQWEEALAAFARAKGLTEAEWLRAEILERLDRPSEAAAAYRRVLLSDPADRYGAALALARLDQGKAPDRAPSAYVAALYDRYAGVFEEDLRQSLDYRGPELLADAVARSLGSGPFDLLDLGCGTGLIGAALHPIARRLDGIDLSAAMIEQARQRGLYDQLTVGELTRAADAPAAYDLVTAGDVFIYLGDLTPSFTAIATALRPGGGIAFSVERIDNGNWSLLHSKRFGHSAAYLRLLAEQNGFEVLLLEESWARKEHGQPLPGLVCVLRKQG